MHIAIPCFPSDASQVEQLLTRIADLGGVSQFPVVLVATPEVDLTPLRRLALSAFEPRGVSEYIVENIPVDYPKPRNLLFSRTAFHLNVNVGDAFLYLDKDAWPLHPSWLKDLTGVYRDHGFRFMGKLAPTPDGSSDRYLMPTAIYPRNFWQESNLVSQLRPGEDFALFLKDEIVHIAKAHDSKLFTLDETDRTAALQVGRSAIGPALNKIYQELKKAGIDPDNQTEIDAQRLEDNGQFEDADNLRAEKGLALNDVGFRQTDGSLIDAAKAEDLAGRALSGKVVIGEENSVAVADALAYVGSKHALKAAGELGETFRARGEAATNPHTPIVRPDPYAPVSAESLAATQTPAEQWAHDPSVFTGEPVTEQPLSSAPAVPVPEGVSVPDNQPPPAFASTEERNAAFRADKAAGTPWRALLSKYGLSPKQGSAILNSLA